MTKTQANEPGFVLVASGHDLAGMTFGDLTAINRERLNGRTVWKMVCVCGNYCHAQTYNLRHGKHVNCGCRRSEVRGALITKHGHNCLGRRSKEYRAWAHIKGRCERETDNGFHHYGGRGIKLDPSWSASFQAFLDHIGPAPSSSHSVGRIDNDRGYVPGNVRWETNAEQARNTRRTVRVDGEALVDVCERRGLSYGAVSARIRRGDPLQLALSVLTGSAYRAARKEIAQ